MKSRSRARKSNKSCPAFRLLDLRPGCPPLCNRVRITNRLALSAVWRYSGANRQTSRNSQILVVQGRGHRLEVKPPLLFLSRGDFAARLFVEQWVTFPRYVLSGGFARAWREAGAGSSLERSRVTWHLHLPGRLSAVERSVDMRRRQPPAGGSGALARFDSRAARTLRPRRAVKRR